MHAEATGLRDRIDQMRERRAGAATEIAALGQIGRRNKVERHAVEIARDRGGRQACGIDQRRAGQLHRRFPADIEFETIRRDPAVEQRRQQRKCRPRRLRLATQRQHVAMAVDDSR